MSGFGLDAIKVGNVAVIRPKGYLNDISGERLEKKCAEFLAEGLRGVVLNFDALEFVNSVGISIVLGIMKSVREAGGELCFTNLGPMHASTFETLGLTGHMRVFETEDEALVHLKGT